MIKGKDKIENIKFDELNLKKELHDLVKAGLTYLQLRNILLKREPKKNIIYNLY